MVGRDADSSLSGSTTQKSSTKINMINLENLTAYNHMGKTWIVGKAAKPTALYNLRNNIEILKNEQGEAFMAFLSSIGESGNKDQMIQKLEALYEEVANAQ